MSSLLDAIGAVGTALDRFTGGRAVRGLLAGKPSEALSILPLTDTLGWTDPANATSGRDLLNQYGLTDPRSQGWGPLLGGMAVDLVTSPLSYLGGAGAAKAAPELAEVAGLAKAPAFLADESAALSWGKGLAGKAAESVVAASPQDTEILAKAKELAAQNFWSWSKLAPSGQADYLDQAKQILAKASTPTSSGEVDASKLLGLGSGIAGQAQDLAEEQALLSPLEQTPFVPVPGTPMAAKAAAAVDPAILAGAGAPGLASIPEVLKQAKQFAEEEGWGWHELTSDSQSVFLKKAQQALSEQALSGGPSAPDPLEQLRVPTVEKKVIEYINKLGMRPEEVSSPIRNALQRQAQREVEWLSQGGQRMQDPFLVQTGFTPELASRIGSGEARKPSAILNAMLEEASQKMMSQWGGESLGRAQPHAVGLAQAFASPAKLPRGQVKANALLEALTRQIEGGLNSIAEYSGPLYYGINKYLRETIGSNPERLDAILGELQGLGRQASETMSPQKLSQLLQAESNYADLHGFDPTRQSATRAAIGQILNLMEQFKTPQPLQLYRGVDWRTADRFRDLIGAPVTSPEAVGREIFDPAFLSTSLDRLTAQHFTRGPQGILFDLGQVPKGRTASFINPTEMEVLFPPGRRLQIEGLVSPADRRQAAVVKAKLWQALLAAMGAGGGAYAATRDQSTPDLSRSTIQ